VKQGTCAGSLACACLLALAAGCSSQSGPSVETGTIVGEVGEPRNRARVHTELAGLYFERGNQAVALEELRMAVASDSSYAPAYGLFGLVYMELKENSLAEENFQRAMRLSPNDPDIAHNYGQFLCGSSREADSVKYFIQAIRNPLYASPWRSYSAAGVCTLRANPNNTKEAEEFFVRALKIEPDEPTAMLKLAQIRYRQGNLDDARKMVTRYNKLVSPNAESLWLALRVERRLGERVAEQSYANQLRRRYPGSPEHQALQKGQYD
jgi:type IV pilus assembly protein PilF